MKAPSRRSFIQQSSLIAAGIGIANAYSFPLNQWRKRVSANDIINVGVIGVKGMGWSNLKAHIQNNPEVRCIALSDVDQSVLDMRTNDVKEITGHTPKQYKDYRKMLDDKDLDAVIIGTPDHWHCLMFCDALSAGKHVYCEKPLANSITECQAMLKAAKQSSQIVQIGQWQRSGLHYQKAYDFLQSGALGTIRLVKTWAYQGWMKPVPVASDASIPDGVDYKMWLGPAPMRPFNPNRFHFNFRWYWDYAGGLMTDWGVHEIDIALHFMGATAPKSVMASGGKFAYPDDASETPDTLQAVFEYDGFNMLWEHAVGIDGGPYGKSEGIAFIGNKGTMVVNREGWDVYPETGRNADGLLTNKMEDLPFQSKGNMDYLGLHTKNFITAIKDNDPKILKCGIETGSIAAINAHMGNVAFKTGRKVYWDSVHQEFKNDSEANGLLSAKYHNGYKIPMK